MKLLKTDAWVLTDRKKVQVPTAIRNFASEASKIEELRLYPTFAKTNESAIKFDYKI